MEEIHEKDEKFSKEEKERIYRELKHKSETSMAKRRKGPLIWLISFSIALWGAKLFTFLSPGTYIRISILGQEIHLHHFHFGMVALFLGIILTFFEGPNYVKAGNILFGAGLGLIVDEYWLLLLFNERTYFDPASYFISSMIGLGMTVIVALITVSLLLYTKGEKRLWDKYRRRFKDEKIKEKI